MHGKCGKGWFGFIFMILAAIVIAGVAVMLLWNWLVPPIFGVSEIHFLQALGLILLARLLFGGLHRGGFRGHMHSHMEKRWKKMTPEEREKFRAGLHHCWGHRKSNEPTENE